MSEITPETEDTGRELTLKEVIDTHTPALYNFIRRFRFDNEEAQDILQDVYIKVWKNFETFNKTQASFKTWIFTITKNTIYDALRKRKRSNQITITNEEIGDEVGDDSSDILKTLERTASKEVLLGAIDTLGDYEKTVLLLHFEEDMTFNELSIMLDISPNTIKSTYRRALIKLKSAIEGMHPNNKPNV